MDKLNFNSSYSNQITIQNIVSDELTDQEVASDVKYQDIIYYKNNRDEFISALKFLPIDFLKAMSKMQNMDWTFSGNYIGFTRMKDAVLFRRKSATQWSASVPIFKEDQWTGFSWFAYSESNTISDMLRLFFEEVPWFGMLSWKMGKGT